MVVGWTWPPIMTVLTVTFWSVSSFISASVGALGSPSLKTIMCFRLAVLFLRESLPSCMRPWKLGRSPWFIPAICRANAVLSPTFCKSNNHRSVPSQSSTPISSRGPSESRAAMAMSRLTWLPFPNSMPCITSTSAPEGSTFLELSSMSTGNAVSKGVLRYPPAAKELSPPMHTRPIPKSRTPPSMSRMRSGPRSPADTFDRNNTS